MYQSKDNVQLESSEQNFNSKSILDIVQMEETPLADYHPPFVWLKPDDAKSAHHSRWRIARRYGYDWNKDKRRFKVEEVEGVGTRVWLPKPGNGKYTVKLNDEVENHKTIYGLIRYYFGSDLKGKLDPVTYSAHVSRFSVNGESVDLDTKEREFVIDLKDKNHFREFRSCILFHADGAVNSPESPNNDLGGGVQINADKKKESFVKDKAFDFVFTNHVKSEPDFISTIKNAPGKVAHLELFSHAGHKAIYFSGEGSREDRNFWKDEIKDHDMSGYFHKDAVVVLWGCRQGGGPEYTKKSGKKYPEVSGDESFAQELANRWNVTVKAFNHFSEFKQDKDGNVYDGEMVQADTKSAKMQTFKPKK